MAPTRNARHIFNEVPTGYPIPGRTVVYDASQTIDLNNVPLHGGILIKTLVLSIDPFMRGRMSDVPHYFPWKIGQLLDNSGVGVVVRSENPAFKLGDHVYGLLTFEEYSVQTQVERFQKIKDNHNLPWSVFLGAAGIPGQTAYCGWKEYAHAKKGEVAFVSAGAGAVGSLVIQLAKRDGLKVIASAGSDEKVAFMKELGADVAFNYKTANMSEILQKEGPIDVYWDNVGGKTLEAALDAAAHKARFIECGMISGYNEAPYPVKNLGVIVGKELTLSGFVINSLLPKYKDAFYSEVPALIASGKFKHKEDNMRGLESTGEAILAIQKGTNTGKIAILVADQ